MAYLFRTKSKSGKLHPRWKFQYTDHGGVRRTQAGYTSKVETEKYARAVEEKQRQIKEGLVAAPGSAFHSRKLVVKDIVKEYLAWGRLQGWTACHAEHREAQLNWWIAEAKLKTLADFDNLLPRVEKGLRKLSEEIPPRRKGKKRSLKTINHYGNTVKALCIWCHERDYLDENPLRRLKLPRALAEKQRRALTVEEIADLLEVAPYHRRALYLVAFSTGLRANELRSLSVDNLDLEKAVLRLDAGSAKNRKVGIFHIPTGVLEQLKVYIESGDARQQYELNHRRNGSKRALPKKPLLYVPRHTAQRIRTDLKAAGIPDKTHEGVVDFHATRTTFITMVDQVGASPREAMTLARHRIPEYDVQHVRSNS
jgi:integrase